MIRKDLHNNIDIVRARNGATIGSSTTTAGIVIDTKGFGAVEFALSVDARTDGTFTPLIEESNDPAMAGAVAVDDKNLFGTEAAAAINAANTTTRVGYWVGKFRYVRLSIVSTAVTTGAYVSALAFRANPNLAPVA